MNCSQQTNGAHVAAANMTTLLQKNCIKTLQMNNGVVVVGTAPVGNTSMINANVVPITSTMPALTTNATATNLQTHTMIANASQMQPIQAFQYQQIQTVAAPTQPQYLIYNPSDGTVFRQIVTTSSSAVPTIVNNTVYQPQHKFVTHNNLPKRIINLNASNPQPKVLNISTLKSTTAMAATPAIVTQHRNHATTQHIIKTEHSNVNRINSGGRQIVTLTNGNNIISGNNIINAIHTTANVISNHSTSHIFSNANTSNIISNVNSANSLPNVNRIVQTIPTTTSNQPVVVTQPTRPQINETVVVKNTIAPTPTPTPSPMPTQQSTNQIQSNQYATAKVANDTDSTTVKEEKIEIDSSPRPVGPAEPTAAIAAATDEENEGEPEIDIVINNVVCSFSVRCHLNLREIALNGRNVEFRRENGMVTMKLRCPYTTASIWSSGRITCTGATSDDQAKIGARRYARALQGLGFPVRFNNFRVVNVLGTCSMPWAIKIVNFSEKYRDIACYEPELHPGVTYKIKSPKATLKIFSTGSITVTAASVADVQSAIEHIFPLVYEFRKKRTVEPVPEPEAYDPDNDDVLTEILGKDDSKQQRPNVPAKPVNKRAPKRKYPFGISANDPHDDNMTISDDELGDIDDMDDIDDM